jgi:hypothetical protein
VLTPKRFVLPALLGAILASGHTAAAAQNSRNPSGSAAQSGAVPASSIPMLVLIPAGAGADPKLYNGCWARLLDNIETPNQKDQLTIVGRMHMPTMQTASGVNWKGKADGMVIGPNALVTAYGEEQYKGPGVVLKPGQTIQDARKELGFVSAIASLKMECHA